MASSASAQDQVDIHTSTATKFMGPGHSEFASFPHQASTLMDFYLRHWGIDISIIPPIFSYKNPNIDDNVIVKAELEGARQNSKHPLHRQLIDRESDRAEQIIHDVIHQLAKENFQAPFMAIRNFKLDKLRSEFTKLFPHLRWTDLREQLKCSFQECLKFLPLEDSEISFLDKFENRLDYILEDVISENFGNRLRKSLEEIFPALPLEILKKLEDYLDICFKKYCLREYDFILIGPTIGLVVIEVKHSLFTQSKHFSAGSRHLPDDIQTGIKQLHSSNSLSSFLQECIKTKETIIQVRQILFLPNLDQQRYISWLNSLDDSTANDIRQRIQGVTIWFQGDTKNWDIGKPPLYSMLKLYLGNSGYEISRSTYEIYAPIFAALATVVVLKTGPFNFDGTSLSEGQAVLRESRLVHSQDPVGKSEHLYSENVAILLSPEQLTALNGPNRQYIIGAAGTGKTVLLQEKSLQLLKENQPVCVLAATHFVRKYRQLFREHGFTSGFQIYSWKAIRSCLAHVKHQLTIFSGQYGQGLDLDNYSAIQKCIHHPAIQLDLPEQVKLILSCDNLLIDDAFDEQTQDLLFNWHTSRIACWIMVSLAAKYHPNNVQWIALDPYKVIEQDTGIYNGGPTVLQFLLENSSKENYSTVFLKRSMRCPEKIARIAYDWLWSRPQDEISLEMNTLLGHKIQGLTKVVADRNHSFLLAVNQMWRAIAEEVGQLYEHGHFLDGVAIIHLHQPRLADEVVERQIRQHILARLKKSAPALNTKGIKKLIQSIPIHNWYDVSSLEWPTVIYAVCLPSSSSAGFNAYGYSAYRACSRALAKLVNITVTHTYDDRP